MWGFDAGSGMVEQDQCQAEKMSSAYFVPPVTPYKLFMCIANNLYHLHYFCTYLKGGLPSKIYAH